MSNLFFKYKFATPEKKEKIFNKYPATDLYCTANIENILTSIAAKEYIQRNGIKIKNVYVNTSIPKDSAPTEYKIWCEILGNLESPVLKVYTPKGVQTYTPKIFQLEKIKSNFKSILTIMNQDLERISFSELKKYMFNSSKQQDIKKEEETMAFFTNRFLSFNLNNYSFIAALIRKSSTSIISVYENCRKLAKKHDIVQKLTEHINKF